MPDQTSDGADRLDSWKAIAEYLDRDLATVRRWEKTLRLPIHRVGGTGRSVFAYKAEVDAWLRSSPAAGETPRPAGETQGWRGLALAAAVVLLIGAGAAFVSPLWLSTGADIRLHVTPAGVIASSITGDALWTHTFPPDVLTAIPEIGQPTAVVGGAVPAAFVATSHTYRRGDQQGGSGELMEFSLQGDLRHSFSFDDELTFAGKRYGPPWAVTAFAVDDSTGQRRLAVAGHHFTWDPSPVTILDAQWSRVGTFAHAGWVEALVWLSPDRLLIGGYSESRRGGMVGLLDPARLNGQGPEEPGTRYYCETCGPDRPLRMVVMPRTEVNQAAAWRFNRALIERLEDRILARTIELEMPAGQADVIYEFSTALELISATFSDRYWDAHRTLEDAGKIEHSREQCPDRYGPREVATWEPSTGWTAVRLR